VNPPERLGSSFRDPSGFVFIRAGRIYRQVNPAYRAGYERLMGSGLYEELVSAGLLIPHREVSLEDAPGAYRVLEPEALEFVSYPYEWCFGALRDAALATLAIQKRAFAHDMLLKDASAYNIQFHHGAPVLIDTLSFARYEEGRPWVAYRQFCQHFLAPLALMSRRDIRLGQLLRIFVDGLPLDLASRLLPRRTLLRFSLLSHLHLHARSQQRHAHDMDAPRAVERGRVSRVGLQGLVESLESAIRGLHWSPSGTEWGDYYEATNYSREATAHKGDLVARLLGRVKPATVWDLGANTGVYSRLALELGAHVVSWDVDPAAVEKSYRQLRREGPRRLLPLLLDLSNPSAAIGWANRERMSLAERGPAELVMALALVHHLAISGNVPLDRIAGFLASLGQWLIIEFIPKSDSQVERLLRVREDIFTEYTQEGFERAFDGPFRLVEVEGVRDSERRIYLYERRPSAADPGRR